MYHVLPINDIGEHIEESTCLCYPEVKLEGSEMICIHNAFDRRELKEDMFSKKEVPRTEDVVYYFVVLMNHVTHGRMEPTEFTDRVRSFMEEYKKKYTIPPIPEDLNDPDKVLAASPWRLPQEEIEKLTIELEPKEEFGPVYSVSFNIKLTEEQKDIIENAFMEAFEIKDEEE